MSSIENREPKRLRSSEPDLQVILGSGDDTSSRWCHSLSLALKSKYIDTMLSTPMREQETRTITFPDISPAIWEKMNKFLDDPLASRDMKIEDTKDLALLYDKYEFDLGCKLCERVILDYLGPFPLHKQDLDMLIDLTSIAHEANLIRAFQKGIQRLIYKLLGSHGRITFSEEHLKKVFSLLKHVNSSDPKLLILKSELKTACHGEEDELCDEDVLDKPGLEKLFISHCVSRANAMLLNAFISRIKLSGSSWKYNIVSNGMFSGDKDHGYFRPTDIGEFVIKYTSRATSHGEEKGWAILLEGGDSEDEDSDDEDNEDEDIICWWAKYSSNQPLPPLEGWVSCDHRARGNPTIQYKLENEENLAKKLNRGG